MFSFDACELGHIKNATNLVQICAASSKPDFIVQLRQLPQQAIQPLQEILTALPVLQICRRQICNILQTQLTQAIS
jgi:hypothetical protein